MSQIKTQLAKPTKVSRAPSRLLQRKCECGTLAAGGECAKCKDKKSELPKKEETPLQRAATQATPVQTTPSVVDEVLREPGQPLDPTIRVLLEPRFGHDFSGVRVHTGARAARSAEAVHARAYTVGNDIVFGANQYQPGTAAGRELIAHELAHTIQQGGLQRAGDGGLAVAPTNDPLEREAERASRAVWTGDSARLTAASPGLRLHRAPWGPTPQGERADARDPLIHGDAEKTIVLYYRGLFPSDLIFSNYPSLLYKLSNFKLEPVATGRPGEAAEAERLEEVVKLTEERFKTDQPFEEVKGSASRRRIGEESTKRSPGPASGQVNPEDFEYVMVKEIRSSTTYEPDILNFTKFQVLDVTTIDQSERKATETIEEKYLAKLRDIYRVIRNTYKITKDANGKPLPETPPWEAGTLAPPPPAVMNHEVTDSQKRKVVVSYAPTDFDVFPGVISYAAILPTAAGAAKPLDPKELTTLSVVAANDNRFSLQIAAKAKQTDLLASGPENQAATRRIPGLTLATVTPASGGEYRVLYDLDLPFLEAEGPRNQRWLRLRAPDKEGVRSLEFPAKQHPLPIHAKAASSGTLQISFGADGSLAGTGHLKPTLPILRGTTLDLTLDKGVLSAGLQATDKLPSPLPGIRLTSASIGLQLSPELKAEGGVKFAAGPPKLPYADGSLTFTADPEGFSATGKVVAHIPGLSQAEGAVNYSRGELTGGIQIGADKVQIPGVKSATLVVTFSSHGFSFEGAVQVQLPTGQPAELTVRKRGERFVYGGKATIDVPALKPVEFGVEYDGEHFSGEGKTGFTYQGFDGDLTVHYRQGEAGPEFTGEGKLRVQRGKVNGSVDVKMNKHRKFSGKGDITYPLTENLVAGAGVVLDENGKLRVQGLLKFPKPIQLFQGFGSEKELFRVSQQFPIPALSIGPVGVIAEISVAGGVRYGVGPGELRDVKIEAGFDPLEEQKNVELHGGAKLVVPAHAGVYLSVDGGLGVGAGFASATGGLNIRGDAGLNGQLDAAIDLSYKAGRFVVDAEAGIHADLSLTLSLGAFVQAHIGIGGFSAGTRKDWKLASYTFGTGSRLGLSAPLHYASDEPFQAPTLDSIKFEKPNIDPKGLLANLFSSAPSTEKEAK